jgi:hypothetical protein
MNVFIKWGFFNHCIAVTTFATMKHIRRCARALAMMVWQPQCACVCGLEHPVSLQHIWHRDMPVQLNSIGKYNMLTHCKYHKYHGNSYCHP